MSTWTQTPGTVDVVLPGDIDDPRTPSGGNVYDRRSCRALAGAGWSVREHPVPGGWPDPTPAQRAGLDAVLAGLAAGAVVLIDGLIASAAPAELAAQAGRLRLVVLVHMAFGDASVDRRVAEGAALATAEAIVATSGWSRSRLVELYGLAPDRVFVAPPGVDPAPVAPGSPAGTELLCVAAVAPHKGHDTLVAALAEIAGTAWNCVCVGSVEREPGFVEELRRRAGAAGIGDRISFVGPRTGVDLATRYAAADLFVLASRGETYGMVVTEALARGVPVLATAVAGLPEALDGPAAPDGPGAVGHAGRERPAMLVPLDDPAALAGALRRWLAEPELRDRLRRAARDRRASLTGWSHTADQLAAVLARTAAGVRR